MTSEESETTPEVVEGGCHCGTLRYRVRADVRTGTVRCNCTWCTKHGWWSKQVKPEDFELIRAGAPVTPEPGFTACPTCHVMVYGAGDMPELEGPFVVFNVNTLEGVDLDGVPVVYLDGLHDTWAPLAQGAYRDPFRAEASLQ